MAPKLTRDSYTKNAKKTAPAVTLRTNENKTNRKKIVWLVGCIILAAFVIYGIGKLFDMRFLPIQTIVVRGELLPTEQASIEKITWPFSQAGLLTINIRALQNSLQQLPWVSQIAVKRIWPNQILIQVKKPDIIARWNQYYFLNQYGEVLTDTGHITATELPNLNGSDQTTIKVLAYYQKMNVILKSLKLSVSTITLNKDGDWLIILDNGMKIELGDEEVLTKLARFVKVYNKIFAEHKTVAQSVDLRYANGMAIQW